MLPRGDDPGKMASVILIGQNIQIRTPTANAIPAQNNNLKFFLQHIHFLIISFEYVEWKFRKNRIQNSLVPETKIVRR